jgi:hypothetical protein
VIRLEGELWSCDFVRRKHRSRVVYRLVYIDRISLITIAKFNIMCYCLSEMLKW